MTDLRAKLNRLRDSQTVLPNEDRIEVSLEALCDVLLAGHEAADRIETLEAEITRLLDGASPLGTSMRKKKGSSWHGKVVGYYSTELTPQGVAIESAFESGSVQIYPLQALEAWGGSELGNQPRVRMCEPKDE